MNTERTSLFLMANLGAEVSRMLSSKEENDNELTSESLKRAENILSQLKNMPEMSSRSSELNALSAAISDLANPSPLLGINPNHIRAYFTPFAMRLMGR